MYPMNIVRYEFKISCSHNVCMFLIESYSASDIHICIYFICKKKERERKSTDLSNYYNHKELSISLLTFSFSLYVYVHVEKQSLPPNTSRR